MGNLPQERKKRTTFGAVLADLYKTWMLNGLRGTGAISRGEKGQRDVRRRGELQKTADYIIYI